MLRRKNVIYVAFLATMLQVGCTKNFDATNTDPNSTTSDLFDPNYLLSEGAWEYSNTGYNQLLFESMWSQSLASTYGYYGNGDKYVNSGSYTAYRDNLWNADFRSASLIYEMQNLTKDKAAYSNLYNIGTLLKVITLQRLTDVYGDIPYTDALKAKAGITQPKYDKQQDIYNSMLTEVETAVNALDATKTMPTTDPIYSGDIAKWKKFGYSLMLRLAMRLTKIDEATAKKWAEKAAAGTFTTIADNAKVKADNSNGFGNATTGSLRVADDYREVRWSEPLIAFLKSTNDPRLSAIAEISQAGYAKNSNQDLSGDNTPAIQIGLPNGHDLNGGATDIRSYPKYPGLSGTGTDVAPVGKYSRPRTAVYLDRSGINMIMTYAETELLLAEAKARGWSVGSTTAAQHYANALTASMKSLEQFNAAAAISDATVATYVAAHPLDISSQTNSLKMINEQYWATTASFFEFIENWINWRRSGYPVLVPVNYPGNFTSGAIPRRVPYQSQEASNNPTNNADAVSRMSGGDNFTSRVWWDK